MAVQQEWGDAVRTAREAAGMTLDQVSARTRIRPAVLRDLEQGSTLRSGGPAYARGHLRAIARVTGADPGLLLLSDEDEDEPHHRPDEELVGTRPPRPGTALVLPRPARERGRPPWGWAGAAAAAVLVVLVLVGALTGPDGRAPAVTGVSEAVTAPTASPPAALPAAAPAAGAALRLQVGSSPSWVSVLTAAGSPLFRGVLDAGSARAFSDPAGLSLTVGNAGSVTLDCGGRTVPAGRAGQVRRYTCAADGLAAA